MRIIQETSDNKFTLDGIEYQKNFQAVRVGNSNQIRIIGVYDSRLSILNATKAEDVEVNGVVYNDVEVLIKELTGVLFSKFTVDGVAEDFRQSVNSRIDQNNQKVDGLEIEVDDIRQNVQNISTGVGGKMYATLQDAIDEPNKPDDGTIFQVSEVTDSANSGVYSFQSSEPDGYKFEYKNRKGISVNTIANLRNYRGDQDEAINVLGYYSQGDGGGGEFYWDEMSEEEDNGGTIFKVTGVEQGRWKRKYKRLNVEDFGAKGDGITDDYNAIQAAASFGEINLLKDKTYYVSSGIVWSNQSMHIVGDNSRITTDVEGQYLLRGNCNEKYRYNVIAPAYKGDSFVELHSTANIQEGDHVKIISNKLWRYENRGNLYKGELTKVERISGNTVFLRDSLNDDYTESGESLVLLGYNNYDLNVRGVTFEHLNPDPEVGGNKLFCMTTFISKLNFIDCEEIGFSTYKMRAVGSYGSRVRNMSFDKSGKDTLGYGVNDEGGVNFTVENCRFSNLRTPVDFSGREDEGNQVNATGPSRHGVMQNCYVTNCHKGGATHGPAEFATFAYNTIINCDIGLQSRGGYTKFIGNNFRDINNFLFWMSYGDNVEIRDNRYNISASTVFPGRAIYTRDTDYQRNSLVVQGNDLPYETYGHEMTGNFYKYIFKNNNIFQRGEAVFFKGNSGTPSVLYDSEIADNNFRSIDGDPMREGEISAFVDFDSSTFFSSTPAAELAVSTRNMFYRRPIVVFSHDRNGAITNSLSINFPRIKSETHFIKIIFNGNGGKALEVLFTANIFSSSYSNPKQTVLIINNLEETDFEFSHSGTSEGHNFILNTSASEWVCVVEFINSTNQSLTITPTVN